MQYSGGRRSFLLPSSPSAERFLLCCATGRRELVISRLGGNILRIIEKVFPEEATSPHREIIRDLDLTTDPVLLLYTITTHDDPAGQWNVEILYGKGSHREQVVYPLLNEQELFRFQKLVTGYEPYKRFQSVTCWLTLPRKKFASVFLRDEQVVSAGDIQLWQWGPEEQPDGALPLTTTRSVATLADARSMAPSVRTMRTAPGTSLQTDIRGTEKFVSCLPPPPVLVCFTQTTRGEYVIIKTEITNLKYREESDTVVHLESPRGTFAVEVLSVKRLEDWNLCALGSNTRGPQSETIKCRYLSFEFGAAQQAFRFTHKLLELQCLSQRIRSHGGPPLRSPPPASIRTRSSSSSQASLPEITSVGPLQFDYSRWSPSPGMQPMHPDVRAVPRTLQAPELSADQRLIEMDNQPWRERDRVIEQRNASELPGTGNTIQRVFANGG